MKQISLQRTKNIRFHCTQFSPSCLFALWICASLLTRQSIINYGKVVYSLGNKITFKVVWEMPESATKKEACFFN